MTTKCKKLELLGEGSFGLVHMATVNDSSLFSASTVAVKSTDALASSSLRKEAKFLKELRACPNIVRCFGEDISTENGEKVYNLLLEYAHGGTLHDMIKTNSGNMFESDVARYVGMILEGLYIIHEKEIVHCDLKPQNILLFPGKDGADVQLKISDFGLAKRIWEADIMNHHRGTLMYSSPEAVSCKIYEKATDIWSLGCIVAEMFTGKQIWSYRDRRDLLRQIVHGKPKIPDNISQVAKDFLERCLDTDHNLRWTAEMLLDHPFVNYNWESRRLFQAMNNDESSSLSGLGEWVSGQDLFSSHDQVDDLCNSIEPLSISSPVDETHASKRISSKCFDLQL